MTTPLTDDQILTIINTVEPIEDWERLIPGALDNPGRYPDLDWLESHFVVMLDNLTSRAVAAAIYAGENTPHQIREHWANGKRRYGIKGRHITSAATGAGILKWNDPRFGRWGRITRPTFDVLERLDRAVGELFGYSDADDDGYLFGFDADEIITLPDCSTPEGRADDLRDGVTPTAKEIELAKDFRYCRRDEGPSSFEWLTLRCLSPDVHDRIAKCEVKQ